MSAVLLATPIAPRAAAANSRRQQQQQPLAAARPAPAQRSSSFLHSSSGSRASGSSMSSVAARGHRVEVELLSGEVKVLDVDEGESILSAMLDEGIDTPYDCNMGVCLRCAAKLEEGEVDQEAGMLSQDVQDMGYGLLCVSLPRSNCKVRVISEDELADEAMATSRKAQEAAAAAS